MRNLFLVGSWFPVELLFSFFNELPPVKVDIVENRQSPKDCRLQSPAFAGACHAKWHMAPVLLKNNTCRSRCLKKWNGYGCRYNFEHDHYSMGIFTCKSQCCASLRNLCANLAPISYFSLGKNLSSVSRQSFEVYPHRTELNAWTASGRFR